jgi:hypothetical protein
MSNTATDYVLLPKQVTYSLGNGETIQLRTVKSSGNGKEYILCDLCGEPVFLPGHGNMSYFARHRAGSKCLNTLAANNMHQTEGAINEIAQGIFQTLFVLLCIVTIQIHSLTTTTNITGSIYIY